MKAEPFRPEVPEGAAPVRKLPPQAGEALAEWAQHLRATRLAEARSQPPDERPKQQE